ncbi:MAG TPA: glycosyltransferase family 2 protein [Thermoanaerobaculia bacterium]|jgi:dolichyl-phosphate beta-glucosyltransferase|nr:glycosyltransferase family 2 protein [Thermoanaerobaculia bacterium]
MASVTIVVPTRNEPNLAQWLKTLHASIDAEVVVVDDSTTAIGELPHARVIRGPDRGKGAAVGVGILAAQGEVIVVVDADLDQATMMRIPDFVERIRGGYDVVIGERTRWRYDNLGRFALSIALFLAQRILIFQSARFFDTQCGLKAYRQAAARKLAGLQTVDGGMYDIEYLYIAVLNGMRVDRVPVIPWPETRATRLRIWRCLRTDPVDLLRSKWNGIRGRYTA